MKVIDLGLTPHTLNEVIELAERGLVVLRKPDGSVFTLSQVDDFDVEVASLKANSEFMALLKQLSQEPATVSLRDLRGELGL